ncbi:ethionine resistance protein [Metarhizium acridum]|uniref:ethionine resistance protein n=1 Tax=Metarhizium acridum TaxID=92637 RepID=UPI001C6C6D39|nr:ethionine resistance protein [Metarhizium acridum]
MATAWLIALGGSSELDTLAASNFTASKDKRNLGILLRRGLLVLTASSVIVVLWCFSEPLFRRFGQPEHICTQSSWFLQLLAPGSLGLACMALPWPLAYHTGFHPLLVAYAALVYGEECWSGIQLESSLSNSWTFAKLALLGFVHVGTEWWAFETVALAAGRLGTTSLAAQSVVMTADQIINTIPLDLGVAESARLGNLLGAQDPKAARRSAHCAAVLSVLSGSIILTILFATRYSIGGLFNSDERVIGLVADIIPYVALFQIADGWHGSCGGALRGMGRQWVGALVNCVSYYGGGLPASIYLAFYGWGLAGLRVGQCVALSLVGSWS